MDLDDAESEIDSDNVLADQVYISDYSYSNTNISASDVGMEVEDTDG